VNTITRGDLTDAINAGTVTVVDALPAAPFTTRHLPGALNLTIEEIASAGEVLPNRTAAIVTYSTDGIAAWAAAGLPLESGSATKGAAGAGPSDDEDAIR